MARRLLEHPKVKVAWNSVVDEYLGDPEGAGLTGLRLRNVVTGDTRDLPVTGAFVAIGHQPNTRLFEGQLEMNEAGYLKVQPGRAATAVPGVFACGDCADPYYRQAITAAGTGCMAAIEAERWLAEQE
jgi:thioredoxin reductase (NADPH)